MLELSHRAALNQLAKRLQDGDQNAGSAIFDHFSPQIHRFFMARILRREVAEDLTQDVFLKIIGKIDIFDEARGSFMAWVWQIARNTLIDYFREKKTISLDALTEEGKDIAGDVDRTALRVTMREVFEAAGALGDEEQEVFALRHISGLSYKELGAALGKSEGAMRVIVHRINKKIRGMI